MSGGHSIIPPSSAAAWVACTGWAMMNQAFPEGEESEASKEGTASHEVAANMVTGLAHGGAGYPKRDETIGSMAENGVLINDEMYDGAEMYAEEMLRIMRESNVFSPGIEQRVKAPRIHELSEGTPDFELFDVRNGVLYIRDYKFGRRFVSEYENWQLINYAAGLLDRAGVDGIGDQYTFVDFGIVQPRTYHADGPIRSWRVQASDLRGFFNKLHAAANKNLDGSGVTTSGPQCRDCNARHGCPAALEAGVGLFEVVGQPIPSELPPEALAVQFAVIQRAKKQIEYLESGFEEQIQSLIRGGVNVPGYRVAQGKGRERWANPLDEVVALGDLLKIDLRKGAVVTPNEAKKLGIDAAVISAYSETPNTSLKVVADDGARAKRIFNNN